jgi:hypothetical protein
VTLLARLGIAAAALALAGCVPGGDVPGGAAPPREPAVDGGQAGTEVTDTGSDGATGSGAEVGSVPPPATCAETPVARPGATATVAFDIEVSLAGKPVVFGETNALPGGGTVTPTNLRFYLSDPHLLGPAGQRVAVDLAGADGRPLPYNVHMASLEDAGTLRFRILAPAGAYQGLGFVFGLNDVCNASDPALRKSPLNPASQMTWPHPGLGLGYLFLRQEALVEGAGAPAPPGVIHMGGLVGVRLAPEVTVAGPVQASGAQSTSYRLQVSLEEIWKGTALPADLDGFIGPPGPEIIAGEHLRQNIAKVSVFRILASP